MKFTSCHVGIPQLSAPVALHVSMRLRCVQTETIPSNPN